MSRAASARLVTPSWSPDGATILFFAADLGDAPFNVFAIDLGDGAVRRVTDTAGGAQFPELSPRRHADLCWIHARRVRFLLGAGGAVGLDRRAADMDHVITGSHADECSPVKTMAAAASDFEASAPGADAVATATSDVAAAAVTPYRPWRTLVPTYWSPVSSATPVRRLIGAGTAMCGRARTARPMRLMRNGRDARRPDWHASYAYDRWRPTLVRQLLRTTPIRFAAARAKPRALCRCAPAVPPRSLERDLAGRVRRGRPSSRRAQLPRPPDATAAFARCGAAGCTTAAGMFGYSISVEEGFAVEAATETSRTALGSDVDAGAALVRRARVSSPVRPPHGAGGSARRRGRVGRRRRTPAVRRLGPGPSTPVFDFGARRHRPAARHSRSARSPRRARGGGQSSICDSRSGGLERGVGSWPIFLRTAAWRDFRRRGQRLGRPRARAGTCAPSLGGELSSDVVVAALLAVDARGRRRLDARSGRRGARARRIFGASSARAF